MQSNTVTVSVSFPDRAIGVDVSTISSVVLEPLLEGGADDVQLAFSATHDTGQVSDNAAELLDVT